ncbi:MAG: murein biosynthesis integral membrane protein MurJ [Desulfobulbaceae bacterium]|uniref:Probable lipid II flippase MurJ n=1 Tax=Candidatus Desulfobia pelagia TaxID=2841692 RepID=A0A8J6NC25_9BACT|nr:murein biosynthesis integral membrane protein MurJ [Candidatus Desulfobia pelagia]
MNEASQDTGKIARSAGTVSIAVMCSRVLGLVREQAFAALFGAGYAYDSFVVAFRIPNLLRDLFGEGALSSAFVTVFSGYDAKKGEEATWQLANNVLAFFAVLVSLITLCGIVFAEPLIRLLVDSEFAQVPGKVELTRKLTIIMFPFLVFISLSAAVMGMLNTKGRFFVPAMASSFFNLGSIIGGVSLSLLLPRFGYPAIMGMAIGTLIGGFLQLAGQLPSLFKVGFTFRPVIRLDDPGLKRILLLMVPAVIGLSATQINIFINTRFASSCIEGSVSWLNYAFRLVQLPIGVFGVAISIATLPLISRYAANKDMVQLKETFASSLTMAFCLTIPASIGLWILAEPIIKIIFEHGAFSGLDTARTAEALRFYAIGLFAYSSVKIMVPVFFALNDSKLPVIASFLAVGANLLLVSLLIEPYQHKAIAMAISGSMIFNFLFLSIVLYRKVNGYSLSYLGRSVMKIVAASVVMGVWVIVVHGWMHSLFASGIILQIAGLIVVIVSAAMIYGFVLYFLKVKELSFVVDKVKSRIMG